MVSKVSLTSSLWLQSIDTRKVRHSCQHAYIYFLAMQSQQQHQNCHKENIAQAALHKQPQIVQSKVGKASLRDDIWATQVVVLSQAFLGLQGVDHGLCNIPHIYRLYLLVAPINERDDWELLG